MYLFLGEPDDALSRNVRQALEKRGGRVHALLHPFSESTRFSWRLDSSHSSSVIVFEDGTSIADNGISGIFLRQRNAAGISDTGSADHSYIQAEIEAALLGWIWSLPCPVINRLPAWLWYCPKPPFQFWARLLRINGLLEVDCYRQESEAQIANQDPSIVCGRACVIDQAVVWSDARPGKLARCEPALIEFTRCTGLSLLEIVIVKTSDGIGVKEVDPFPDLSRFCSSSGAAITEALVKLFTDSNRPLGSQ
jgi:hypothetical protein